MSCDLVSEPLSYLILFRNGQPHPHHFEMLQQLIHLRINILEALGFHALPLIDNLSQNRIRNLSALLFTDIPNGIRKTYFTAIPLLFLFMSEYIERLSFYPQISAHFPFGVLFMSTL